MKSTLNNRFAKNVSWLIIGRVFQMVMTFITTMLIARYLGPTQYGVIGYTYSYVALFIPICTLGMNDIAVKELVDDRENNETIMGTMLGMRFASSLLSIGLSLMIIRIMYKNPVYFLVGFLQSLSLTFQIFDTIVYFYQSKLMSQKIGIVYILGYGLSAIFKFVCLYLAKSVNWFAFAVSFEYLSVSFFLLSLYFKEDYRFHFSLDIAKRLIGKSYHYIFSGIMVVIYSKADTIFLGNLVDETNVGYYSAATTLCNAWPFILTAIIETSSPIIIDLYKRDKDLFKKRLKQLYAAIVYIGVAAAICFCILAKFIIGVLYGSAYLPAIVPLRIVCWSTIFAYLGVSRTIWMQCEGKMRYEKNLSLMGAIFDIILNYILIKNFQIAGAAAALLLTQFFTNFVFVYLIKDTRENAKLILDAIILRDIF